MVTGTFGRKSPRANLDLLEAEYRKLQELRERVRRAEAVTAKRLKSRGKKTQKGSRLLPYSS
jgi:hypothetical protein